ncbi:Tn3 family transposase [Streptomyces puniciscabiei]
MTATPGIPGCRDLTNDRDQPRKKGMDLMQVGLSVREGTLSSVTLLRRLNNHSRKNQIYKVYREVGRAVRTVVLLRYLSDPQPHNFGSRSPRRRTRPRPTTGTPSGCTSAGTATCPPAIPNSRRKP